MEQFLVFLLSLVFVLFIKGIEFFYKKLPIDMNFFLKSLLSVILPIFSIFLLLILVGVLGKFYILKPHQEYQAKARYTSSEINFLNAKKLIMDEIAKCNQETTMLSFVASDGKTQALNFVCPFNLTPYSQEAAMSYFRRIVWDKFKNPHNHGAGIIKGSSSIDSAARSAEVISQPGIASDEGKISITASVDSTSSITLMINLGQIPGSTKYEVLTERIELISQQHRRDQ